MMMNFEVAVAWILRAEGGLSDHPQDPGGLTKYGISQRAYPELDIARLTEAQARALYRRDYWEPCRGEALPVALALVVFDCAVNQGVSYASRTLQRCVKVAEDGVIGPVTLRAVTQLQEEVLVARYLSARAKTYTHLPTAGSFLEGWFYRLFRLADRAAEVGLQAQ